MSLTFSQRMGLEPIKEIQTHSIDTDLRNRLWNAFHKSIWNKAPHYEDSSYGNYTDDLVGWSLEFWEDLTDDFFKQPTDELSFDFSKCARELKHYFLSTSEWNHVYDLIEFICNCSSLKQEDINLFIQEGNKVLEKEMSGYRIVDQLVTPITNSIEIASIEKAVKSPYEFANQHLHSALKKLSDRDNPDYRNSIKESITAIDSICTKLMGTSTLGKALDKIESKLGFNKQLKQGLEKLYSYTNGGSGIRHPLTEEGHHPTCDEAKFMLVACSAFVNYLTAKASVLSD